MKTSKDVFIGCFYRPPDSGIEYLEELDKSIKRISAKTESDVWLAGDFNLLTGK